MAKRFITSESVTEGHPDKLADRISDAILDAILEKDKNARVACEVFLTKGLAHVGGEITTTSYVDINSIVRQTIREVGYTRAKFGFDGSTCGVIVSIEEQSPDIALGVNKSLEAKTYGKEDDDVLIGAGDQGMMFGYATDETEEYMPLPIVLAHRLAKMLAAVRKNSDIPYLWPDGKTQVTVEYEDDKPIRVDTIIVSAQHKENIPLSVIKEDIIEKVIKRVIPSHLIDKNTKYYINPTGRFVIGGPMGDTGLTGRKIIVDTYGGIAHHGGGAFSGKDPTKVDRSAAYMARYIAKNIVAAGLANRCEVQLSYAIGIANPISINVNTFNTAKIPEEKIVELIKKHFNCRPAAIIKKFDLLRPIYKQLSSYGHFGRLDLNLPWEMLDKVEPLRKDANL